MSADNIRVLELCGGTCLEDLELRRQDEAYLNLLGAQRIPDPTTAGDFCRRFSEHDLTQLHAAFDAVRKKVWARQPAEFFAEARLDADGTLKDLFAAPAGLDAAALRRVENEEGWILGVSL